MLGIQQETHTHTQKKKKTYSLSPAKTSFNGASCANPTIEPHGIISLLDHAPDSDLNPLELPAQPPGGVGGSHLKSVKCHVDHFFQLMRASHPLQDPPHPNPNNGTPRSVPLNNWVQGLNYKEEY